MQNAELFFNYSLLSTHYSLLTTLYSLLTTLYSLLSNLKGVFTNIHDNLYRHPHRDSEFCARTDKKRQE